MSVQLWSLPGCREADSQRSQATGCAACPGDQVRVAEYLPEEGEVISSPEHEVNGEHVRTAASKCWPGNGDQSEPSLSAKANPTEEVKSRGLGRYAEAIVESSEEK